MFHIFQKQKQTKQKTRTASAFLGVGVGCGGGGGKGGAVVDDIFGLHNFDILELNQTGTSKSLNSISSQISEDDKRVRNDRDVCKNLSLCS